MVTSSEALPYLLFTFQVLIDMASTLREEEPFATHHRMHVSLAEVLSWLGLGFGFGLAKVWVG